VAVLVVEVWAVQAVQAVVLVGLSVSTRWKRCNYPLEALRLRLAVAEVPGAMALVAALGQIQR
jgi:hypothetical protein